MARKDSDACGEGLRVARFCGLWRRLLSKGHAVSKIQKIKYVITTPQRTHMTIVMKHDKNDEVIVPQQSEVIHSTCLGTILNTTSAGT